MDEKWKRMQNTIYKLKQEELTYSQNNSIIKHQNISDYEKPCSTEKYILEKMEYTIKCLDNLKNILFNPDDNKNNIRKSTIGDTLSFSINNLFSFLKYLVLYKGNPFPSVLYIINENFTLDDIIGLAHMKFIGLINKNGFICLHSFCFVYL